MGTIFEQELEIGGYRTRAIELAGEGVPFLLLHGFSDSADTWRPVLDRLRREGRRAMAVDLIGFGRAQRLDRDGPVLEQLDRFVAACISELADSEGAIVVGNSLGGCLAIRAAQDANLPVRAIVPVAPAGLDLARWLRIIEGAPAVQLILRSPLPLPGWAIRQAVGQAYRTLAFARPRAVQGRAVAAFTSHVPTKRDVIRILGTGRRLLPEIADPFAFERVSCPVLVVWGERDALVYSSGAERILEEVPAARIELLADCGHCPQVEMPERFVELLLGFARGIDEAPATTAARA